MQVEVKYPFLHKPHFSKRLVAFSYRYTYNGKELDKDFGSSHYDFGARIYDGRIARWLAVDKYAKSIPNQSAYCYATNSPILTIDEEGNYSVISHYKWTKRVLIEAGISRKTAKEIAHYASTYADHPNKFFAILNQVAAVFNGVNPNRIAQREGKFGSYDNTKESQSSSEVMMVSIHAMRTYFEDISADDAVHRALHGWEGEYKDKDGKMVHIKIEGAYNVIKRLAGKKLDELTTEEKKDLGVALHTIQDAEAHKGARWLTGKEDKKEAKKLRKSEEHQHEDNKEDTHKNHHPNGRCVGGKGKKEAKEATKKAVQNLQVK